MKLSKLSNPPSQKTIKYATSSKATKPSSGPQASFVEGRQPTKTPKPKSAVGKPKK